MGLEGSSSENLIPCSFISDESTRSNRSMKRTASLNSFSGFNRSTALSNIVGNFSCGGSVGQCTLCAECERDLTGVDTFMAHDKKYCSLECRHSNRRLNDFEDIEDVWSDNKCNELYVDW